MTLITHQDSLLPDTAITKLIGTQKNVIVFMVNTSLMVHQHECLVAYLRQELLWPCKWQYSWRLSWALVDVADIVSVGSLADCFELIRDSSCMLGTCKEISEMIWTQENLGLASLMP
ncbi:hypothetical protein OIU84_002482 [Salix udensis]|uniref:Uncharacterized protein n=1 Tax=Salix udensis TaxID=889485 RepID=A0AAD6K424_9ROSI|nr:hypothetical protein OIU84_002482 [Salix udensis]